MSIPNSPDENEDYVDARLAMQAAEEGFASQNQVTAFLQYLKQRHATRPQSTTNTQADIEAYIEACRNEWTH